MCLADRDRSLWKTSLNISENHLFCVCGVMGQTTALTASMLPWVKAIACKCCIKSCLPSTCTQLRGSLLTCLRSASVSFIKTVLIRTFLTARPGYLGYRSLRRLLSTTWALVSINRFPREGRDPDRSAFRDRSTNRHKITWHNVRVFLFLSHILSGKDRDMKSLWGSVDLTSMFTYMSQRARQKKSNYSAHAG